MISKFKFIQLLLLAVFMSCVNTNKTANSQEDVSFKERVSSINVLKLPFSIYCGVDFLRTIDDPEIKKIAPKNSGIIGRLPNKDNREYILYGINGNIIYPYLYIYDDKGLLLDSLYLHIGPCLGDDSIIVSNGTTINYDYSINMADTTRYIHYIENIELTDSIVITKKELILNKENLYTTKKIPV